MTYKVGSLFAGVGGICLGFKNAQFQDYKYELTWANEIDEHACCTYAYNFSHLLIPGDIEKIVKPEREEELNTRNEYLEKQKMILKYNIDILTGGFPCQAFSIAGYRKGFDDHRGNLFMSIVDLIKLLEQAQTKPKALFLENVKNLLTHDNGNTYKVIKGELEKLGYTIKEAVLNTKDYSNLPQNRERIYIVGFLDKKVADSFTLFDNDTLSKYKKNKTDIERKYDIENILELEYSKNELGEFYYTKQKYPNYFITEKEYNTIPLEKRKDTRINLDEDINENLEFYQVRRGMYVRKNQNGVCPTLTANMGTGGHNVPLIKVHDGIRKLTPSEAFKLQGFPVGHGYKLPTMFKGKKLSNSYLYKQAGNAVSVDVITLIATEMLKALKQVENN